MRLVLSFSFLSSLISQKKIHIAQTSYDGALQQVHLYVFFFFFFFEGGKVDNKFENSKEQLSLIQDRNPSDREFSTNVSHECLTFVERNFYNFAILK